MQEQGTKFRVLSNLFWKFFEQGGTQGIQFIIQIVLARLLLPRDYGIIVLIMIFVTIGNIFVNTGFLMALVQKKDANETDFSSVFYISLCIAVLLYCVLFFTAPFIATFFEEPQLISLLRVLSLILFFGAFSSIQKAVIARNLLFKKLFYSSFIAVLISGVLGVMLAYIGFGAWALVAQQLTNHFLIAIVLWYTLKWRPKLLFSFKRLSSLFSFGWKILVAVLINELFNNLRSLFVGKLYDSTMLGFYNRGMQFPAIIVTNINDSILAVIFPVLASQQGNRPRVKSMLRRSIITSTFIITPMMFGLIAIAEPLVTVLLTEKWLPVVPFLQIYCLTYLFWPIHTSNFSAINALGRSDITLKLEILKKSLGFIILFITAFYGVYAIAIGGAISGFIFAVIDTFPNRNLLNYSYLELLNDIMPSILSSICMGVAVYSVNYLNMPAWETLIVQIILGLFVYYIIARLFKVESYKYVKSIYQEFINSKQESNFR